MKCLMTMLAAAVSLVALAQEPAAEGAVRPRGGRMAMAGGPSIEPVLRAAMNPKLAEKAAITEEQVAKLKAIADEKGALKTLHEKVRKGTERQGDVRSLSALVERNAKWLKGFLRGLTPSDADAEDAFQDTWMRVIRSCGSYRGGSVRAYLATIARSVVIDRFRRTGRPTVSIDVKDESGAAAVDALASESPSPGAAFEKSMTAEDVRRTVRALPSGQREVVLMRIEGEIPFKEIAEALGIPLGTALTWMHAATDRLKRVFAKEG